MSGTATLALNSKIFYGRGIVTLVRRNRKLSRATRRRIVRLIIMIFSSSPSSGFLGFHKRDVHSIGRLQHNIRLETREGLVPILDPLVRLQDSGHGVCHFGKCKLLADADSRASVEGDVPERCSQPIACLVMKLHWRVRTSTISVSIRPSALGRTKDSQGNRLPWKDRCPRGAARQMSSSQLAFLL